MKIIPRGERILLKQVEREEKTSSGIFLPSSSQEIESMGVIIALGEAAPKDLKIGDKVIYPQFKTNEIKLSTGKVYIVEAKEILGIVR